MNKPPLIGIAGKARVGKNTLATFIEAQYGGYQYAFADPMRAMLHAGLGIDFKQEFWRARKEAKIEALGKSPRELMQTLGTDWGRQLVHPDLWVILAMMRLSNTGPGMIVTDVRFENEAHWIRKNGGTVLHLKRSAAPSVADHTSEAGIIFEPANNDIVIFNDLDLESLQHTVGKLWE